MASAAVAAVALPATASSAATRAEYVAQVEPICAAYNVDVDRLEKRRRALDRKELYRAAAWVMRLQAVRGELVVSKLGQVTPAPGDEATIARWLGLVRVQSSILRQEAKAHRQEQFDREAELARRRLSQRAEARASVSDFGFQACVGRR